MSFGVLQIETSSGNKLGWPSLPPRGRCSLGLGVYSIRVKVAALTFAGFDLRVEHAHPHVVKCTQLVRGRSVLEFAGQDGECII